MASNAILLELTWVSGWIVPVYCIGRYGRYGGTGSWGGWGRTGGQGCTSRPARKVFSGPLQRELLYIFTRLPFSVTDPTPVVQHAQLLWWTRARKVRPCPTCPFQALPNTMLW